MNTKLIPNSVKSWVSNRIKRVASQVQPPLHALKYIPYHQDASSYLLEKNLELKAETVDNGLPVPPDNLWLTYGPHIDEYLSSGKMHVSKMLELVMSSGFSLPEGSQILDFGCGAGRMIRHLKYLTDKCRIWGTDISAPHIMWAKQYLNPPFHFALTTTIPHLPFEDRSFRFIYCGSLFTHIEEFTETWLSELRRILSPGGRLYITIHDEHTIKMLDSQYSEHWLAKTMKADKAYSDIKNNLGMLVLGRDTHSNVFYNIDYFVKIIRSVGFNIVSITQMAYSYQTAVLVEKN